jgi:hypothetical protein
MEQHEAKLRWPGMQAKRDDDLKDSFYLYIMRNSIGAGLRSQYAPNGHMPDRLAKLLKELNSTDRGVEDKAAEEKEDQNPQPARKHTRKR